MFFRSRSRDWQLKRAASIGSASGSKKKKTLIPRRHVSTSGGENFGSSTWLRNIPCDANLRIFDITSTATSFSSKGRTSEGRSVKFGRSADYLLVCQVRGGRERTICQHQPIEGPGKRDLVDTLNCLDRGQGYEFWLGVSHGDRSPLRFGINNHLTPASGIPYLNSDTDLSAEGRQSKWRSENWSAAGFSYSSSSYALGVNVLYACTDESKTKEVAVLSIC